MAYEDLLLLIPPILIILNRYLLNSAFLVDLVGLAVYSSAGMRIYSLKLYLININIDYYSFTFPSTKITYLKVCNITQIRE